MLGRVPRWFSHSDNLDVTVKGIATKVQEINKQIANGKENVVKRMCVRDFLQTCFEACSIQDWKADAWHGRPAEEKVAMTSDGLQTLKRSASFGMAKFNRRAATLNSPKSPGS